MKNPYIGVLHIQPIQGWLSVPMWYGMLRKYHHFSVYESIRHALYLAGVTNA